MIVCVGSHAAFIRGLRLRKPKDLDLIATNDSLQDFIKAFREQHRMTACYPTEGGKKTVIKAADTPVVDVEMAWPGSTGFRLLGLLQYDKEAEFSQLDWHGMKQDVWFPSLNVLFMLKDTHRFLRNSPHFEKTRTDWITMRKMGLYVPDAYQEWYEARIDETYYYKHPKLNQNKDSFFKDDGIKYVYDHDTIHLSAARVPGIPAYTVFQKEGEQVAVDREKWAAMTEQRRLDSVIEEATVLALERSQIPHPNIWTPEKSYVFALQKVCTSITSGWWRNYAYEVYDRAKANWNPGYVDKFWADVTAGLVRKL